MRLSPFRFALALFAVAVLCAAFLTLRSGGSAQAAAATPQPSPTEAPTPFMPLALIPNGEWEIIEQTYYQVVYSRMTLKEVGDSVTGTWFLDNKTTYVLDGTRDGSHLSLQIKSNAKPDATIVGKMEADIDGIADMVGLITLGKIEVAFQGAQHGRVPPPVDNTNTPAPEESPF